MAAPLPIPASAQRMALVAEKMTNMTTGKVIAAVAASLDGFVAGPDDGPGQALGLYGAPLSVVTHHVPDEVPPADPPQPWRLSGSCKRPASPT